MSVNRVRRHRASVRAMFALLALTACQCATAALIFVNTTTDEFGENLFACGLREAIQASNTHAAFGGCVAGDINGNSIVLQAGTYSLTRSGNLEDANSTGDLDITSDITMGPFTGGPDKVTINGRGQDRLFHIRNATVAFYSMTLTNGDPHFGRPANENQNGGAVAIDNSAVDFNDCVLRDNKATFGGAVQAFNSGSQVTFNRSSLIHNYSTQRGGAAVLGFNALSMKFLSSTVSGNKAGSGGGGIDVEDGTLTLNNATIAYNEANYQNNAATGGGGGILANGGTVKVSNSIIADNRSHAFVRPDCEGGLDTFDYSLISNSSGCSFVGSMTSSLFDVEPGLAPLFDYGGHKPAHHPRYFSPVINTASFAAQGSAGACEAADQRGMARQGRCDMGAIQWNMNFVVDRFDDAPKDPNSAITVCGAVGGGCTLRAAIMAANAQAGVDAFSSILLPAHTLDLSILGTHEDQSATGDLDIHSQVNIFGPAAGGNVLVLGRAAVNAHQIDRAFDIEATAALVDFDVTGGDADNNGGAMWVQIPGNVLFYNGGLSGNVAATNGGGLYLAQGVFNGDHCYIGNNFAGNKGAGIFEDTDGLDSYPLNLQNCTVLNNTTPGAGGGIYVNQSQAYLDFVTIAFNSANTNHDNFGNSGGIANGGTVILTNTLISNNRAGVNGTAGYVPNDCTGNTFGQFGQNLVQTQGGCTFTGPAPIAADPFLVGNRYYSYLPLIPASLAYHAVPQNQCRDLFGILEQTDQRGAPRPAGGLLPTACSIGAYEGFEDRIFANDFELLL